MATPLLPLLPQVIDRLIAIEIAELKQRLRGQSFNQRIKFRVWNPQTDRAASLPYGSLP